MAEADHAALAVRRMRKGTAEDEAALAALAAKRSRILENYDDGHYDKATRDAKLAAIAESESKLSATRWIKRVGVAPKIDTGDSATVNAYLRRLFSRVEVDMSQPAFRGPSKWTPTVAFEWRDPSLRVEESEYVTDDDLAAGYRDPIEVGPDHIDFEDGAA
jgi:hypothetical protein